MYAEPAKNDNTVTENKKTEAVKSALGLWFNVVGTINWHLW